MSEARVKQMQRQKSRRSLMAAGAGLQVGSLGQAKTLATVLLLQKHLLFPFLAWGLAISHWNPDWTEAEKRSAIAAAIPFHQVKGTRAAVEQKKAD